MTHEVLVCSFFGVILIARPRFLFGGLPENGMDGVTPGQRMISVTSGRQIVPLTDGFLMFLSRFSHLASQCGPGWRRRFDR